MKQSIVANGFFVRGLCVNGECLEAIDVCAHGDVRKFRLLYGGVYRSLLYNTIPVSETTRLVSAPGDQVHRRERELRGVLRLLGAAPQQHRQLQVRGHVLELPVHGGPQGALGLHILQALPRPAGLRHVPHPHVVREGVGKRPGGDDSSPFSRQIGLPRRRGRGGGTSFAVPFAREGVRKWPGGDRFSRTISLARTTFAGAWAMAMMTRYNMAKRDVIE